jgi:hypothetical protein
VNTPAADNATLLAIERTMMAWVRTGARCARKIRSCRTR